MDPKKTYELTIAEKLGALPLPDLRESVWSRIENGLDADPPADVPDGGAGPTSPYWRSFLRFGGAFAVVVALVTIVIVNRQKRKNQPSVNTRQFPATQTVTAPSVETPKNKSAPAVFPGIKKPSSSTGLPSPGDTVLKKDPVTAATPLPVPADTGTTQPTAPPLLVNAPPPAVTDTMKKKSRGVRGITDGDYRIVPKKDTTRE